MVINIKIVFKGWLAFSGAFDILFVKYADEGVEIFFLKALSYGCNFFVLIAINQIILLSFNL